uniref:Uncharacterized protein n=1 Tax=Aegilops tauschii subsp. strangulata TaxID=200361 RepID=A0A453PNY8_AEGTS
MFVTYVASSFYRGYIEAVRELEQQIQLSGDVQFDDIVVACGRYFISTCYSVLFYGDSCVCALTVVSCLDPKSCGIDTSRLDHIELFAVAELLLVLL